MPSSFVDSVPPIIKAIIGAAPRRVVDVGPGWGKYGLMCREYLPDLERLVAVEAYCRAGSSLERAQRMIYDEIAYSDVRALPSGWWDQVAPDLTLIIDVIEHLSHSEGHDLIDRVTQAGSRVLVSTPKVFMEQHDDENPFEDHVSHWTWEDFARHGIAQDVSTVDAIIMLLG